MQSKLELELELDVLNKKIIFYSDIYRKLPFQFLKKRIAKRIDKTVLKRDFVFVTLRDKTRETNPEKFIGGDYGKIKTE